MKRPIYNPREWRPISTAPLDRWVLVFAPSYEGLSKLIMAAKYHPSAGWCIDELRRAKRWQSLKQPLYQLLHYDELGDTPMSHKITDIVISVSNELSEGMEQEADTPYLTRAAFTTVINATIATVVSKKVDADLFWKNDDEVCVTFVHDSAVVPITFNRHLKYMTVPNLKVPANA